MASMVHGKEKKGNSDNKSSDFSANVHVSQLCFGLSFDDSNVLLWHGQKLEKKVYFLLLVCYLSQE